MYTAKLYTKRPTLYDYKNADWQAYHRLLNNNIDLLYYKKLIHTIDKNNLLEIDQILNNLVAAIIEARNEFVPKKYITYCAVQKYQLPDDIIELKRIRNS